MAVYEVEIKYATSTIQLVQADDEGEALDKARNKAEETDMNEFNIVSELESRIVSQR